MSEQEWEWFPPPTPENIVVEWNRYGRKWCAVERERSEHTICYFVYVDDSDGRGWRAWNLDRESSAARDERIKKLEKERDEALDRIVRLTEGDDSIAARADRLAALLVKAEKERDEARGNRDACHALHEGIGQMVDQQKARADRLAALLAEAREHARSCDDKALLARIDAEIGEGK